MCRARGGRYRVPLASLAKTSSEEALLKLEAREMMRLAETDGAAGDKAAAAGERGMVPPPTQGPGNKVAVATGHGLVERVAWLAVGVSIGLVLAKAMR